MAIARWNPFDELTALNSALDRLFGNLYQGGTTEGGQQRGQQQMTFRLPIDVKQTDRGYLIETPVPGMNPEDVDVTFADGVLTITANRREERTEDQGNYLRRELVYGSFRRQIALPPDVKPDSIDARVENGMLRIEVERAPRPQEHKVEVRKGEQGQRQVTAGESKQGAQQQQKATGAAAGGSSESRQRK